MKLIGDFFFDNNKLICKIGHRSRCVWRFMLYFLKDRYNVTVFEKKKTPGDSLKCCRINGSLSYTMVGHVFNSKHSDVLDWF